MLRPLSAEETAENYRKARQALRRWFLVSLVPGLALLWAAGYGKGLIDGGRDCPPAVRNKDSNND